MHRVKSAAVWLAPIVVVALVAWPVYAHCGKCLGSAKDMVKKMDESKLSMAKAIEAAEAHSKGKALTAHAGINGGKLEVGVYCLAGEKIVECTVDSSGKVAKMEDRKALDEGHKHEEAKPTKP